MVPGILSPTESDDGFRGIVQPIMVSQQGDQFDGTKEIFPRWGWACPAPGVSPRCVPRGFFVDYRMVNAGQTCPQYPRTR